jgi:hypothetical protein
MIRFKEPPKRKAKKAVRGVIAHAIPRVYPKPVRARGGAASAMPTKPKLCPYCNQPYIELSAAERVARTRAMATERKRLQRARERAAA